MMKIQIQGWERNDAKFSAVKEKLIQDLFKLTTMVVKLLCYSNTHRMSLRKQYYSYILKCQYLNYSRNDILCD